MLSWLRSVVRDRKQVSDQPPASTWPGPRPGSSILFLDFDGVMHPAESGSFTNLPHLMRVLESCPHVDLVLSTNWRINATRDQLLSHFPPSIHSRIAGVTPVLGDGVSERQRECEAYLAGVHIRHAVALDDDASLFDRGSTILMLLDRYVGLDAAQATSLIYRLSSRTLQEA